MGRRRGVQLRYDVEALRHLKTVPRKHHSLIRRSIESQLKFEPAVETANRKPLRAGSSFGNAWELRCGPSNRFRVFYRSDVESGEIRILAIGVKEGNQLTIGREEFDL